MTAKEYIELELGKVNVMTSHEDAVYIMNGIYVCLEDKGFDRHDIKLMIDSAIINNIKKTMKDGLDN